MSKPLTTEELQFLARLAKLPEGQRYMAYLSSKLADADQALRDADSDHVLQAQGGARAIADLLRDLKEAGDRLERSIPSRRPVLVANPFDR